MILTLPPIQAFTAMQRLPRRILHDPEAMASLVDRRACFLIVNKVALVQECSAEFEGWTQAATCKCVCMRRLLMLGWRMIFGEIPGNIVDKRTVTAIYLKPSFRITF